MRAAAPDGYSLVEVACVVAILATLGSIAIPPMLVTVDEFRTSGAARHVAARLQRARMDAVLRSASVGLQVTQTAAGYWYAVYVDGNRNGIRTIEIQQGTDRALVPAERLPDQFPGVEFGAIPGLPAVDAGGTPPGTDPVRLGSGNLATFSPIGTSSSGTLYIRGRRNTQCAVRLYGQTGKVRVLKFDARSRQWVPL
jgi:prepilin-type N-terminal cleavage/methylation domain-containing protein